MLAACLCKWACKCPANAVCPDFGRRRISRVWWKLITEWTKKRTHRSTSFACDLHIGIFLIYSLRSWKRNAIFMRRNADVAVGRTKYFTNRYDWRLQFRMHPASGFRIRSLQLQRFWPWNNNNKSRRSKEMLKIPAKHTSKGLRSICGHSANQTIRPSFSFFQLSHFSAEIVVLLCTNKGIFTRIKFPCFYL